MAEILAYIAAAITGLWGIAHAIPTKQVVAGFRDTSVDNRRVLLQEWLAEAVTMWALAAMVVTVTASAGGTAAAAGWVDRVAAGALIVLAALTSLTGARTAVIWFKICPVLLGASATLLLLASFQ